MKDKIRQFRLPAVLLLAALMVLGARAPKRSSAYFTAHTRIAGNITMYLNDHAEVHEDVDGFQKKLTVGNKDSENPIFIRVKIMHGSVIDTTIAGSNWRFGKGGYWYYALPLNKGETAPVLVIDIQPHDDYEGDFNVVCAEETTPAVFNSDGSPIDPESADWEGAWNQ